MEQNLPHKLTLNERSKLTVTGVTEVVSFDEETVVLRTVAGGLLVQGRDMHMKTLSTEGGQVVVEGQVDSLAYQQASGGGGGFFRRLLK